MKYKNKKTGYEISTECSISGGNWEEVEEAEEVEEKKETKKKTKKAATPKGKKGTSNDK